MRNFSMQLYLFDGINGSLLGRKRYRGRANWTFSKREQVGSSGGQFWQSSLAREVGYQLKEAAQDIAAELPVPPSPPGSWLSTRGPTSTWAVATGSNSGDQFRFSTADFVDPMASPSDAQPCRRSVRGGTGVRDGAIISSQNKYRRSMSKSVTWLYWNRSRLQSTRFLGRCE